MVELMVSIAMIAIIMVFLVKLLVDVRYDVTNELYDTEDQVTRAEIIKTIENDLKDESIKKITPTGDASYINITFTVDKDGTEDTSSIYVDERTLTYSKLDGTYKRWTLKTKNKSTYIQRERIPYRIITNNLNDYMITIDIPIIVDERKVGEFDSRMDNIILTFYGTNNTIESDEGYYN